MESVKATEQASASVAVSPLTRVSLADIEANISAEYTMLAADAFPDAPRHPALELLTIHIIVLRNGFTVIGKTAPADPVNFNADLGRKFAREDAIRQIWPLMGYALREKLAGR